MLNIISKNDYQYFVPILACIICFFVINIRGLFLLSDVSYWSSYMIKQPYRIITYHFNHKDGYHMMTNIFGIIVARYFLKSLSLHSDYFFLAFIVLFMPLHSFICRCIDNLVFLNYNHLLVGFDGVLFGIMPFILMTTIYGKKKFINIECGLTSNPTLLKSIYVLTSIGIIRSFLPGLSLIGHMSGLLAGFLLYWL